ncbi:hypothetical protein [Brevundimonas aurantiaca]|jgi:hypothetical protein|uniref:hypothetical protein n=1 Tax=Brevundimonas aurantiaca TaxID=74316 RepID=UPI001D196CA7|nr:hypothetical protein [Brevundimonas aurantiaca]MCC4295234.1 hypothetical protein [Brevundimonas aurantiaca]
MLQEYVLGHQPEGERGLGVSVCFMCKDALRIYRDAVDKGLSPQKPFVGNGLWVVGFRDPDDYNIVFESPTDVEEEVEYDPNVHG